MAFPGQAFMPQRMFRYFGDRIELGPITQVSASLFGQTVPGGIEQFVVSEKGEGAGLLSTQSVGAYEVYAAWERRGEEFVQVGQSHIPSRGVGHLYRSNFLSGIKSAFGRTVWETGFSFPDQGGLSFRLPFMAGDEEPRAVLPRYFDFDDGTPGSWYNTFESMRLSSHSRMWINNNYSLVLADLSDPAAAPRLMLTGLPGYERTRFVEDGVEWIVTGVRDQWAVSDDASVLTATAERADDPDLTRGIVLRVPVGGSPEPFQALDPLYDEWHSVGFVAGNLSGQMLIETKSENSSQPENSGLYAIDADGTLYTAVETGDTITLNGTDRVVTSTTVVNHPDPVLGEAGWFVVGLELDENTWVLGLSKVPGPCPADVNEDGQLSVADY